MTKITAEQYDKLKEMKPEDRTGDFGNPVTNRIIGILMGFSKLYDLRDGRMDLGTTRDAEKEIKQLIADCGGDQNHSLGIPVNRLKY